MTRKSAPNGLTTGAGGGYLQRRGDGLLGNAGANTGNAGSGDPAYRAALWAVGTVPLPGVYECFVSRWC